jgi:hypothetical protein
MVKLEIWQKTHWLRLHKERLRWEAKHPGKFRPTPDPFEVSISRYTCALCGERRYYRTNGSDKDMPQYHRIGKRSITLCHSCWHLRGIYRKHANPRSLEGIEGCRYCHLKAATKKNARKLPRLQADAQNGQVLRGSDEERSLVASGSALQKFRERDRTSTAPTRTRRVRRKGVSI